ncbi:MULTISPECIES: restriction endonuclease [Bacillus cereus group]|uniref:restriction endonuclease n=1 Tax=Bacillus cereus group TaxID=86661 RepID=UPI0025A4E39F|nr:restriction endonuclease [Bacillus thuringiensis]MDM8365433.1 restriction endonuclease [Bacillus thuringiensis]
MAKKSAKEKLQELEEQMKRLKEEERDLKRKAKAEEKKKRDMLCKDTGELAEKYFNIEHLSIEDREALFESISVRVNEKIENSFPITQQIKHISSEDENNNTVTDYSPVAL